MRHAGRETKRLPSWIKIRLTTNERLADVRRLIRNNHLNTVCQSAACPNQTECWNSGTATFLILGNICTRRCRFCNVPKGKPEGLDSDEPKRVAKVVELLQLNYAVVTSVTRDDLPDGGAAIFSETIKAIRSSAPNCRIEVLIPDFQGSEASLHTVLQAGPDVLNHNIETVPVLYPSVRPLADYQRSLTVLARTGSYGSSLVKSGLMLGLGETKENLRAVMMDLRNAHCDILTLGQYLQPTKNHLPVKRFYHPDEFSDLRTQGYEMGFRHVVAGPLVRSSYHAEQLVGK